MKIAVDVSDLCTDRADGTTRYTRELANRLPPIGNGHDWQYLAPCSTRGGATDAQNNLTWHSSPWPQYWTQLRLPTELYRLKPDVLCMPIQQLPYLRPGNIKTVAVIHDLAIHYYPQQFTYKDWLLLHVFSAQVARQADHIIAVSHTTAEDIARFYGRTTNVHVVHHGVDHQQFRPAMSEEKEESWNTLRVAYPALRKSYLLYVGQIQPRKNLIRLIEAFEIAHERHKDLQLVMAGSHGWMQKEITARIESSLNRESILVIGRVPPELLPALYWHAAAFALISLYEGFGMPIVEAMASGCPVITSNVSSMPEVAGNAAVLVNPLDTASMVAGITTALQQKDRLSQAGLIRAQQFNWDTTARKTLAVLEQ